MSPFGTKRTFYVCRRMSVLGGKAVVKRTYCKNEVDPKPTWAGLKSRIAAVLCYALRRKHGRFRAVKRRALISLLIGGTASDRTLSAN